MVCFSAGGLQRAEDADGVADDEVYEAREFREKRVDAFQNEHGESLLSLKKPPSLR